MSQKKNREIIALSFFFPTHELLAPLQAQSLCSIVPEVTLFTFKIAKT